MDEPETMEQGEEDKARTASKVYLDLIKGAEKAFTTYQQKCDNIDKQYADLEAMAGVSGDREFKMFWANLEILKETVYSRPPVPAVQSRFKDRKDLTRRTSEILERALSASLDLEDIHSVMQHVRDDLALGARGVPWVLDTGEIIHVDRRDFLHDPCRKWRECGWVARRAYISKREGIERFGVEFKEAKTQYATGDTKDDDYHGLDKLVGVWEMWHREKNKVFWLAEGVKTVLEDSEPLFSVDGFFPCPKPAYGTVEHNTLKPVPDYVFYRDQLDEINELTARISSLSESLRMKGFYAAGASEVGEAIETAMRATDNKALLVPVSNAAALGGAALKDSIIWLPVVEIANTVQSLILLRKQLIEDVYEITGLSDIMRGSTDANETLGAQQLKSQYGSVRVSGRQGEMVRVARDAIRIKAEIFAESYSIQELLELSQVDDLPTDQDVQQMAMQAQQQYTQQVQQAGQEAGEKAMQEGADEAQAQQVAAQAAQQVPPFDPAPFEQMVTVEKIDALLKNQRTRPFILDVETDSTIQPDEEADKASRMEFMNAIGGFIAQAGPMVQAQPESAPFVTEMMKFVANGFRAGREMGATIDEFADKIKEVAARPHPNPQAEAMQVQQQAEQQKQQFDQQMQQQQFQMDQMKAKLEGFLAEQQAQADLEKTHAEIDKIEADTNLKIVQAQRKPEVSNAS